MTKKLTRNVMLRQVYNPETNEYEEYRYMFTGFPTKELCDEFICNRFKNLYSIIEFICQSQEQIINGVKQSAKPLEYFYRLKK